MPITTVFEIIFALMRLNPPTFIFIGKSQFACVFNFSVAFFLKIPHEICPLNVIYVCYYLLFKSFLISQRNGGFCALASVYITIGVC